jgi:hypothetical protein
MMAAANSNSIPFYEFQHGGIDAYYPPYIFTKKFESNTTNSKCNLVLYGNFAKEMIVSKSFFNASNIHCVGNAKMEITRAKALLSSSKNNSTATYKILWAMQPLMPLINMKIIEQLNLMDMANCIVQIKPHPNQPANEIEALKTKTSSNTIQWVDKSRNIYDCLFESNLVISVSSTVLEEAISLKKPVITIGYSDLPNGIHSLTGSNQLYDVIQLCNIDNLGNDIVEKMSSESAKLQWQQALEAKHHFIYSNNFTENIATLFK